MIACAQYFFSLAEAEIIVIHYVFASNEDMNHAYKEVSEWEMY